MLRLTFIFLTIAALAELAGVKWAPAWIPQGLATIAIVSLLITIVGEKVKPLFTKSKNASLTEDPKEALATFLNDLKNGYYPWYDARVDQLRLVSVTVKALGMIVAFATTTIAAFATKENMEQMPWMHLALVVLPLIGALLAAILAQWRIVEGYQLREDGRRSVQHLINIGRAQYAAAKEPQNFTDVHLDLAGKLNLVEREQGEKFFVIARPEERSESPHSDVK